MPTYKLPKVKKSKSKSGKVMESDDYYERTIYLPVNEEIINALEVGKSVEVSLRGKLVGMSMNKSESGSDHAEIRIQLEVVSAYDKDSENMYSELAEDE